MIDRSRSTQPRGRSTLPVDAAEPGSLPARRGVSSVRESRTDRGGAYHIIVWVEIRGCTTPDKFSVGWAAWVHLSY